MEPSGRNVAVVRDWGAMRHIEFVLWKAPALEVVRNPPFVGKHHPKISFVQLATDGAGVDGARRPLSFGACL